MTQPFGSPHGPLSLSPSPGVAATGVGATAGFSDSTFFSVGDGDFEVFAVFPCGGCEGVVVGAVTASYVDADVAAAAGASTLLVASASLGPSSHAKLTLETEL